MSLILVPGSVFCVPEAFKAFVNLTKTTVKEASSGAGLPAETVEVESAFALTITLPMGVVPQIGFEYHETSLLHYLMKYTRLLAYHYCSIECKCWREWMCSLIMV